MDGSEEGNTVPAAVLSGAPVDLQARTVRIYKPTKTATQSGAWQGHHWRMDWDILGKGHRWENPLMGWQSSGDFMQGTHLYFKSREDAIGFAEKQGYVGSCVVDLPGHLADDNCRSTLSRNLWNANSCPKHTRRSSRIHQRSSGMLHRNLE